MKKLVAAGAAVLVLGGAAVGVSVVQAQSTPAPATGQQQQNPRDRYTQALANRLHVTVDQLKQAIQDARKDVGAPDATQRPKPSVRPPGAGRPGMPGAVGRGGFGFLGKEADAVASLFKEDRAALMQELPGKTLAELAAAHSVSTQDVVNTIVKTANDQFDQFAQNRNIPADRLSQMKQRISERAQEFVTTHRFPARGSGTRS